MELHEKFVHEVRTFHDYFIAATAQSAQAGLLRSMEGKSTWKGVAAEIKDKFTQGALNIDVDAAKKYVAVCASFTQKGFGCKGIHCKELHITKDGRLKPSLGLMIAVQCHTNPTAQPNVYIDPVLALQGFLQDGGSKLIIDRMIDREGVYVFKFISQPIAPHVMQIARQGFVNVKHEGLVKQVCSSGEVDAPKLCLHCVKQFSLDSSLNILVNGFDYGEVSRPFGIYTVDANQEGQSKMIASYDGGAAIVLKPTGFLVNISDISSGKRPRENPYKWLSGAVPGTILFRRMVSGLREFILHQDSIQFHYFSVEKGLFDAWLQWWGPSNQESLRQALHQRQSMNRVGIVEPSSCQPPTETENVCEEPQILAAASNRGSKMVLAQSRSRSRSRSRSPHPIASGVEIRPPPSCGESVPIAASGLGRMARSLAERYPERDEAFFTPVFEATEQRVFDGSNNSEPDRRGFLRSAVKYLNFEMEESMPSSSSATSLEATRKVLSDDNETSLSQSSAAMPPEFLPVGREEVMALRERMEKTNVKAGGKTWLCDGIGCERRLSDKSEWQKQKKKNYGKTFYYCLECWDTWNIHP